MVAIPSAALARYREQECTSGLPDSESAGSAIPREPRAVENWRP